MHAPHRSGANILAILATAVVAFAGSAPAAAATAAATSVDDVLSHMTLQEKVGQLFVSRVYGRSADTTAPGPVSANHKQLGVDNAAQLVARYHVGGIVYFDWAGNLRNPQQIAKLSNGIQTAAMNQHTPVPEFINTDQEHGAVVRVGPPATQFPGNMALGATRNAVLARRAGAITGQELAAIGINQDLAPVADVNVNPANPVIGVRSFGSQAPLVSELTAAQVHGMQDDGGIAATAKHFPGHGDTDVDSHTGLPVIHHTRAQWEQIDAPPFEAAIAAGVDVIMTAHISVPALDPSGLPATLSRPIITGILRKQLGFHGVVITDSLGMAGVRETYGDARVPVLALKAGVDMLVNPPRLKLAYNAVLAAVNNGELTEHRIDKSVRRILELKQRLGLFDHPLVDVGAISSVLGTSNHLAVAQKDANESITLVKNAGNLLPTPVNGKRILVTGWSNSGTADVSADLRSQGATVKSLWTGYAPSQSNINAAVSAARSRALVVVLTAYVSGDSHQRQLVQALVDTGTPVVTVSVREPYDVAYYTEAPVNLAAYATSAPSMRAVADAITGVLDPTGKLPVMVPHAGNPNSALYHFGRGLSY
jgi:beta-N-acetylhexosaminidase